MAFSISFYVLSKRENSTLRPSGSPAASYTCTILTSSGVLNPSIELNLPFNVNPTAYNYAYIETFGRYYYVSDWVFSGRLWTAQLKVDVLATYRTAIGATQLYVLRASAESDGRVVDNLYPTKTGCTFSKVTAITPWAQTIDRGVFIIGIVSEGAHYGSLEYYAVGYEDMAAVVTGLISDVVTELNRFDFTDASQQLQLNLIDPLQYIKSCIYLPVANTNIPGTRGQGNVKFYKYEIPIRDYIRMTSTPYFEKNLTFNLPKHPQTQARGAYVNQSPYTNITLSIPPFGVFNIDTTVTSNAETLTANIRVDVPTGRAILSIFCGDVLLQRAETQLGVSVQLTQVTKDYIGAGRSMANGAAGVIGSLLSGDIVGAITGGATAIGDAYTAMIPKSNSTGSGGSYAQYLEDFRLDAQFFEIVDDDNAHNGRPLCKLRTPAALGGYMRIQDGDVPIDGTLEEAKEIKSYLEGGFYFE